jgi:hypothetical protein
MFARNVGLFSTTLCVKYINPAVRLQYAHFLSGLDLLALVGVGFVLPSGI